MRDPRSLFNLVITLLTSPFTLEQLTKKNEKSEREGGDKKGERKERKKPDKKLEDLALKTAFPLGLRRFSVQSTRIIRIVN